MIKYIGSKRKLLPWIADTIQGLGGTNRSVIDLFSGTSRVGHHLKGLGYQVISNDLNRYAHQVATCYVQADLEDYQNIVPPILDELQKLPGVEGYVTQTFCRDSRYFQPFNGMKIDAIRDAIEGRGDPPELKAILLVSLMEAADRVDSTTGVQMAYLKKWSRRSYNPLQLRMPHLQPASPNGKCQAHNLDACVAAAQLTADIAYLDPPYNQHKYLGNYHIWETLVRWDAPEHYGVACKRIDVRERKSPFNSKRRIRQAMSTVVANLDVSHVVVSFSDEGYLSKDEMIEVLSERGNVRVVSRDHDRYVGARIGIHSPSGEKVGSVSHTKNTEYLFVC